MRLLVSALACAALLGACGDDGVSSDVASPGSTTAPPSQLASTGCPDGPCIEIVEPQAGAEVTGGTVEISTRVSNFELADEGRIVFYRLETDDAVVPTQSGSTALSGGDGIFTSYPSDETSYSWENTPGPSLPSGDYTFAVQLVTQDNEPLDPPQIAEITLSIQE
jgi:hypothetical protein